MADVNVGIELEMENRYALTFEENQKLKKENRMLRDDLWRQNAKLQALREMVDRLQEAIVNQALLIGAAMEWKEEVEGEAGED